MSPTSKRSTWCPTCRNEVESLVMLDRGDEIRRCGQCGTRLDRKAPLGCVLLAEDSEMMRRKLGGELRARGLASHVVEVGDGRDLLVAYAERLRAGQTVGLIIVDINLPGMNGVEASKAIRALEKGVRGRKAPILFFSSLRYSDGIRRLVEFLGMAGYLHKGAGDDPAVQTERFFHTLEGLLHREGAAQGNA